MATYHGFSSENFIKNKTFGIADLETVKQDLMNHIYTPLGDRVMMPNFGTRIPFMVFEPNDETSRAIIEEDLRTVFEYDPRVNLLALEVVTLSDLNTIVAFADLFYIEFNVQDMLHIEIKMAG